jgi:hypothetical protein
MELAWPPCADHVFTAVQPYRLAPVGAPDRKKICPTAHVFGRLAPDLIGTFFACVLRSICVWPAAIQTTRTTQSILGICSPRPGIAAFAFLAAYLPPPLELCGGR